MSKITTWVNQFLSIDRNDRVKLINLSFTFFFIISSYSVLRSLKTSVFLGFVGREFLPISKIISLLMLFPIMMIYSKLIDNVRRYQVVMILFFIYAIIGLVFSLILVHPVYGVGNTLKSPYRLTGWLFEFFMDFYQALIVSSFWSFVNSISTPEFANKTYGIIVAISRIGGIATTLIGLVLLESSFSSTNRSIPLLVLISSCLLFAAAFFIYRIVKEIPREQLHGYSAAYEASVKRAHSQKRPGIFEGLKLMLTEPYVMGLFGMVCCFEVLNIIFDYKMEVLMSIETNNNIHAMSKFMLIYTASFQAVSFFLAFFGTTSFLKYVGVRVAVLVMPLSIFILGILLFAYPNLKFIFVVLVLSRALNYGFNNPIREVLYIPTIKDVQFKSKAWVDSFGRTISKSSGSVINLLTAFQSIGVQTVVALVFVTTVSSIWLVVGYLMGKKYVKTIENNEVIGGTGDEN